jgi:hypothetical protein
MTTEDEKQTPAPGVEDAAKAAEQDRLRDEKQLRSRLDRAEAKVPDEGRLEGK